MNFQTICRICVTNNLEMVSIFEPYDFSVDHCEIFKVITDCASVQIQQCDGFSEQICRGCLEELSRAYRFKKLCEDSDYKFRNNLIASDDIPIKNEIYEEEAEISYGEIHNHIIKNTEGINEITNFEFIGMKKEQHDDEIRSKNKIDKEENETKEEEQDTSRLRSLLTQSEPSGIKEVDKLVFKCKFCEKKFAKKGNLVHHNRLHSGERPHKCNFCEKTFISSSNLNVHIRSHTGEQRYNCDFCEKKFKYRSNLTRHIRLHMGEKRYKCDFCQKKFTDESNLANHIRIHTGEKRYECEFCQKKFTQSGGLTTHVSRLHMRNK